MPHILGRRLMPALALGDPPDNDQAVIWPRCPPVLVLPVLRQDLVGYPAFNCSLASTLICRPSLGGPPGCRSRQSPGSRSSRGLG